MHFKALFQYSFWLKLKHQYTTEFCFQYMGTKFLILKLFFENCSEAQAQSLGQVQKDQDGLQFKLFFFANDNFEGFKQLHLKKIGSYAMS